MPVNNGRVHRIGFMKKPSLMIIGVFLLLYIAPLGVRPIVIPDESRYGEIPREMIASGDWIVPHLNGLRYFEKPVLGYWINAVSMILFGENAFAIRLPSAMAAGISALMLFIVVRRFAGGYSIGVLAASLFLTCVEVFAVGTFSALDSLFSLFNTGCMVTFLFAHMEKEPVKKIGLLTSSGVFCGLAFLTKGFIAFVLPSIAILPFMIWEHRWKEFVQVCSIPVLTAVLISLPWAVMIHVREPDFWNFFFWNEHIKRFMADNAQHKQSFLYFFLLLPAASLPWSFLFPAAVLGMRRMHLNSSSRRFALCWFFLPLLFFSLSSGKLLTYVLPCFPPFAVLMVTGLHHYLTGRQTRAFTMGALVLALLIGALAVTLLIMQTAGLHGLKPYAQNWRGGLAVAGFLSWALVLLISIRKWEHQKKMMQYALAPALLMFVVPFIMPDQTIEHKAPGEFLLEHSPRIRPDTILVSDEIPVCAVCWFYRRTDVYILGGAGELSYGTRYKDSEYRLLNLDQFRDVILKNRGTGRVTLIAKARKYENWKHDLPGPLLEDSSGTGGFVFAQY